VLGVVQRDAEDLRWRSSCAFRHIAWIRECHVLRDHDRAARTPTSLEWRAPADGPIRNEIAGAVTVAGKQMGELLAALTDARELSERHRSPPTRSGRRPSPARAEVSRDAASRSKASRRVREPRPEPLRWLRAAARIRWGSNRCTRRPPMGLSRRGGPRVFPA
jgi:hypothetical protein